MVDGMRALWICGTDFWDFETGKEDTEQEEESSDGDPKSSYWKLKHHVH